MDDARTYDAARLLQANHRGRASRRAHRGLFDDGATEPLSRAVDEEFFAPEEEEGNLAESIPIQGVVQHTLEVSLTGECSLPTDSGASVTYRLANEDQELWWDSDSSRLNSRLRHDFSTPLASVEVAAVRCLVGDGSSGVDFAVEVEGDAYVARLPIRDVKALVRRDVRDFACTLPLTRRGQSTPFTLPLTFGYRREPDAVARVRASRESLTVAEESLVEEEEEPTVIVRARRAFLQDEAPAPRDDADETLSLTVSGARGLGAVLRAWRTQGRGSGTFPLEETAHVTYAADLEVRVLSASNDEVLATVTSPSFSFSGADEENDVLDSTVLLPQRSYRSMPRLHWTSPYDWWMSARARRRRPSTGLWECPSLPGEPPYRSTAGCASAATGIIEARSASARRTRLTSRRHCRPSRLPRPSRHHQHRSRRRPNRPWPTPPLR